MTLIIAITSISIIFYFGLNALEKGDLKKFLQLNAVGSVVAAAGTYLLAPVEKVDFVEIVEFVAAAGAIFGAVTVVNFVYIQAQEQLAERRKSRSDQPALTVHNHEVI